MESPIDNSEEDRSQVHAQFRFWQGCSMPLILWYGHSEGKVRSWRFLPPVETERVAGVVCRLNYMFYRLAPLGWSVTVGVFLSGDDVGEKLAGPQRAKTVLDERQDGHDKKQRDGWEPLLFVDARLVEERSNAQLIEGLVDLGFNIEATAFDFPLDGK